jgi:hypothetical protein
MKRESMSDARYWVELCVFYFGIGSLTFLMALSATDAPGLLALFVLLTMWLLYSGVMYVALNAKGMEKVKINKSFNATNSVVKNARRYCLGCQYPLFGLRTHRCPECGKPFDPYNAQSFTTVTKGRRFFNRLERFLPPVLILLGIANLIASPMLSDLGVGAVGLVCVFYGISLIPPPGLTTLWPKE